MSLLASETLQGSITHAGGNHGRFSPARRPTTWKDADGCTEIEHDRNDEGRVGVPPISGIAGGQGSDAVLVIIGARLLGYCGVVTAGMGASRMRCCR